MEIPTMENGKTTKWKGEENLIIIESNAQKKGNFTMVCSVDEEI